MRDHYSKAEALKHKNSLAPKKVLVQVLVFSPYLCHSNSSKAEVLTFRWKSKYHSIVVSILKQRKQRIFWYRIFAANLKLCLISTILINECHFRCLASMAPICVCLLILVYVAVTSSCSGLCLWNFSNVNVTDDRYHLLSERPLYQKLSIT